MSYVALARLALGFRQGVGLGAPRRANGGGTVWVPGSGETRLVVTTGERTAVLERELTAADLDSEGQLTLLRTTDPLGVLSIYVDAGSAPSEYRIDVGNRLNELQRRISLDGTREQRVHSTTP